jgi:hypothetical protein
MLEIMIHCGGGGDNDDGNDVDVDKPKLSKGIMYYVSSFQENSPRVVSRSETVCMLMYQYGLGARTERAQRN